MNASVRVVVVDAISSGRLFGAEIRDRGWESVHVQSIDPMHPDDVPSFIAADHIANIIFDGDLERCARRVQAFEPVCVIAGSESGVQLADLLSERLGLATNGTALSAARRNKFEMHRALAAAGVPSIPSRMSDSWKEVEAWVNEQLPVVVKPPSSGGTEQVFICPTTDRARDAFHAILGGTNTFGEKNEKVLVQRFLSGTEYQVNGASCNGKLCVTDIWRADKIRGEHPLYECLEVLSSRGSVQDQIVPYAAAVLEALGIRYGASHMELMLTDRGPILIEVGARPTGQSVQPPCELVTGVNQIKVTLDGYLAPEQFLARAAQPYELRKRFQRVELISPRAGLLRALPRLEDVRGLRSFHAVRVYVQPGHPIPKTIDLLTIPGFVDLIHEDPAVVDADHRLLRQWEADDFYEIAAS